jgi:hypothetical protein
MLAADAAPHRKHRSKPNLLVFDAQTLFSGIVLAGFALRLAMLGRFSFHPDEAIYSFWALYGQHVDPLFLQTWPDKPPIHLWLLGWIFDLFGTTPVIARLPNIFFSTLSIAVVAALARHWWGVRAGLIAALLLALNPFSISFAPTAFTDPLMVLAGLLAVYAALCRRYLWAGVWLGVTIMTKQQGLLFAPLVLAFAFQTRFDVRRLVRNAMRLLAGLLLIVAPILYWDSLRWAVAPSPWELGARNAAGFALSAPDVWLPRLLAWADLSRYLLGNVWLWVLALGALLVMEIMTPHDRRGLRRRPVAILAMWAAAFLALHVLSTVQIWDRYLLPLAPVVALLGAFGAEYALAGRKSAVWKPQIWTRRHPSPLRATFILSLWLLLLTEPAVQAAQGQLPIGGDRGAYTGIEQVAAWLETHADALPVVYHRTVGWHFRFHLFVPIQDGHIDLRWVPSTVHLADNAAKTPHRPRYVVEADWSPERNLTVQLAMRGLSVHELLRAGRFTLYEIVERTASPAAWRVCRMPDTFPHALTWRVHDAAAQSSPRTFRGAASFPEGYDFFPAESHR